MRHVRQAQLPVREMLAHLLRADAIEKLAEADAFMLEAPLESSDVRAERVGDLADRGPP